MEIKARAVFVLSREPTKEEREVIAKLLPWEAVFEGREVIANVEGRQFHHEALRVRKKMREELAKYKLGVRKLEVRDLRIKTDVDVKLPWIKREGEYLIWNVVPEDFVEKGVLDRLYRLIEEKRRKREWGGKKEHWELMKRSDEKPIKFEGNPTEVLIRKGWIKKYPHIGMWFFTPGGARLIRTMERILIEELLKPLGFREAIFPKLIPFEIWKKTGHIKGVAHEIYYVCPPAKREEEFFEEVTDYVKVIGEVPGDILKEKIREPVGGMCYAQCPPFYWFFSHEVIPEDLLPIKWFDRSGPSYRWESGGVRGLERVNEFHRVEVVWLGEPEQVVEIRDKIVEKLEYIFDRILDIEWREAWVTPWYVEQAGGTELEDKEKRIVGTIDFEAYLPFRGGREEAEWLEIQNVSIHGDKFTKAFAIRHQKGKTLWTGCAGTGLERWVVAFIARHGPEYEDWPDKFKKYFGEKEEEFKLLTWPTGKEKL